MKWLQRFEEDIVALAQIRQEWFEGDLEELIEEMKDVLAPLEDGTLDPGDLQAVADQWWNKFSSMEIEAAKKEVEIQRRSWRLGLPIQTVYRLGSACPQNAGNS